MACTYTVDCQAWDFLYNWGSLFQSSKWAGPSALPQLWRHPPKALLNCDTFSVLYAKDYGIGGLTVSQVQCDLCYSAHAKLGFWYFDSCRNQLLQTVPRSYQQLLMNLARTCVVTPSAGLLAVPECNAVHTCRIILCATALCGVVVLKQHIYLLCWRRFVCVLKLSYVIST